MLKNRSLVLEGFAASGLELHELKVKGSLGFTDLVLLCGCSLHILFLFSKARGGGAAAAPPALTHPGSIKLVASLSRGRH